MITKDDILRIVQQKGPLIPITIAKQLNLSILFASAFLSELTSSGKVIASHIKYGSTPLYYVPGQEARLQEYVDNLNDKEKKAYDLLKKDIILRNKDLEPIIRVAMSAIKDFAKSIEVNLKEGPEIFWKWYLTSNEEAAEFIKNKYSSLLLDEHKIKQDTKTEIKTEVKKEEPQIIQEEKKDKLKQEILPDEKFKEDKQEEKKEGKSEKKEIQRIEEKIKKETTKITKKEPEKIIKELNKEEKSEDKLALPEKLSPLFERIIEAFRKDNIEMLSYDILNKNKDIELIVKIPTPVGKLTYFCKAKDKKRINDSDLSLVLMRAQSKNLPALILITGELTKKTKGTFENEFKGLAIKKI